MRDYYQNSPYESYNILGDKMMSDLDKYEYLMGSDGLVLPELDQTVLNKGKYIHVYLSSSEKS